jgi:Ser-tRNA(Ala) deacylase AlaX
MQELHKMTNAIFSYEKDPYARQLSTEVTVVGEAEGRRFAVLRDTLCYPGGGGQPYDRGTLGDVVIQEVIRVGSEIRHFVDGPIAPGPIDLSLDWDRRFDHMQQHTAQHLLSSLSLSRLGWETRSFHIGPEVSDIEIGVPPPDRQQLDQVEELVAEVIRMALPIRDRRVTHSEYAELEVRSRGLPAGHTGEIRLVEIEGLDLNTCGGTHLRSTAEVEIVEIIRAEPLRGGSRLYWVAGGRARRRLGALEVRAYELRQLLGSADEQLVETIEDRLEQLTFERRRAKRLEVRLAVEMARRVLATDAPIIDLHLEQDQAGVLRPIAEELRREAGSRLALITAEVGSGGRFAIVTGRDFSGELHEIGVEVGRWLGGRGGGRDGIFQGKYSTLKRRADVLSYLSNLVP